MDKQTLFERLQEHHDNGPYPFHMPGHKRNLPSPGNPYELDITEISGFDSLHHATGILKEASRRAARLYRAEDSYLLVGGSTAGLLCIISACAKPGGSVLVARNCHRAVYHAIYLNRLRARYVYPRPLKNWGIHGGIAPEDIEEALRASNRPGASEKEKIRAVIVTSPTYEGVVSDISAIADCCHKYNVPLIVDEAHGAHFGFHEQLPASAVQEGADGVVQSLHKTMPALTQTGLLHVQGPLVDRSLVRRFFSIYQTSSPSYVLMGSAEQCIALIEEKGKELFASYWDRLSVLRSRLERCRRIRLFAPSGEERREAACKTTDPGRVVLSVRQTSPQKTLKSPGLSGKDLMDRLREEFGLEMEMAGLDYVTAIVTPMDTKEGLGRLCGAVEQLDQSLERESRARQEAGRADPLKPFDPMETGRPEIVMDLSEAWDSPWESCPIRESEGRISGEFLYLYPPGIPVVVPGERITGKCLELLLRAKETGLSAEGPADLTFRTVRVVKEEKGIRSWERSST